MKTRSEWGFFIVKVLVSYCFAAFAFTITSAIYFYQPQPHSGFGYLDLVVFSPFIPLLALKDLFIGRLPSEKHGIDILAIEYLVFAIAFYLVFRLFSRKAKSNE